MYTTERFDGTDNETTVSVGTTSLSLFTGLTISQQTRGWIITNNHATAIVYFRISSTGSKTVTTGRYNFRLAAGAEKTIQCGPAVVIYALSDTATTPVELVCLK